VDEEKSEHAVQEEELPIPEPIPDDIELDELPDDIPLSDSQLTPQQVKEPEMPPIPMTEE